jgi:hypothetical protein
MEQLLDVIGVEACSDGTLLLEFENHERRRFNMNPYLSKRPFTKLQDPSLFLQAKPGLGTVVWPGDIDIAPETLWDQSVPIPKP